ncbi:MAG: SDR family NAD(P)-dependent oxidoreductase [Planctomycetaceae bacterium]|nr:SDR family oxidoreductase [Planctomycetaceae bacterium]MDG2390799.1 SDR family NAD(P)-dependent oxidoreductase [Planctomycetaceae bacterium]
MESLKGKVVVITGANQGIGKGLALAFAAAGCRVAICARNQTKLAAVAEEILTLGADVLAVSTDVSDESAVQSFFQKIDEKYPRIDILINNAGAFDGGRLDEVSLDAWNNVVGACLTGSFLCSREAFARMKETGGGRILNIGSISAQRPRENSAPYASAKFGVWGLTQATAIDGRPFGIACSCLHPGNVGVERRQESETESDQEPMMATETIVEAAMAMLSVPAHVNFLEAIVLPNDQLYLGRG